MINNRMDVNDLLVQMREMKSQATGQAELQPRSDIEAAMATNKGDAVATAQSADFAGMFNNAINSVNETQQAAGALATAYQQGDPGVSLSQVMVASQKSSVSFQALTQVRNKLVEAYQDVMKMPI